MSERKYQAVIFDLDGVLCHTDEYHYLSWKKIADKLTLPFDREKNHRLRGVSRMESLAIVVEDLPEPLSQSQKNALAEEKNQYYREYLKKMTPQDIAPEVLDTLQALQQAGIPMAIGSSSKNARFILERTGLTPWFGVVVDGTDITHSKPHPEVFLTAAKDLGFPPIRCLVVEDADAGVQAAHAGGMDCAAIGDAANSGDAEYTLQILPDLLPLLLP